MMADESKCGWPQGGSWWAAVAAVAATYVYFLLFAEFALIELAQPLVGAERLRLVMGLLGIGGVAGSGFAAWRYSEGRLAENLARAFVAAGATAGALGFATRPSDVLLIVPLVGLALGALTVTLAAGLRAATRGRRLGLAIGLGTGGAYLVCNLPMVFQAEPREQAVIAAVVAGAGAISAWWFRGGAAKTPIGRRGPGKGGGVSPTTEYTVADLIPFVAILLVLVWLDSAAFYVIQHTDALKAQLWTTPGQLGLNATVHLGAAVLAGWALDRGGLRVVIAGGFLALGLATVALSLATSAMPVVQVWYTAGVSLYSTALVYVPARTGRAWHAAIVYAISGWIGSALGIGMAQDLHRVPLAFLIAATLVAAVVLIPRRRLAAAKPVAVAGALVLASVFPLTVRGAGPGRERSSEAALIARGREVYIAEGCIHCHSQFVRPGTSDGERWGPERPLAERLAERPPLFGNRRQGPDLAQVGNRRSPEWNRLHLMAPRALSPGSRMPSYAHLFATGDGEALVAYLASLNQPEGRRTEVENWRPAAAPAPPARAARLFRQWCASCHGESGRGDGSLAGRLSLPPPDFTRDPWRRVRPENDETAVIERIIKFGLQGTPMAGHEFLSDPDVSALALYVRSLHDEGRSR